MTPEIAALQAQIAAIQINIEWLTKLVWAMITLNGAAILANGFVLRNSKGKR